ncbi:MAG: J domain-containing protein, partial [Spirochaetota bacterium]
ERISVDQLFDRLGDLLKSWMQTEDKNSPFSEPHKRSGDPFLDDAMEELNAFLEDDRDTQARLERERLYRMWMEEEAHARARPKTQSGPPAKLSAAYKVLGLTLNAPFDQVRKAYKQLLKQHHPDKHGSAPDAQKKATETSARINDAYRIIETWHETGALGNE